MGILCSTDSPTGNAGHVAGATHWKEGNAQVSPALGGSTGVDVETGPDVPVTSLSLQGNVIVRNIVPDKARVTSGPCFLPTPSPAPSPHPAVVIPWSHHT